MITWEKAAVQEARLRAEGRWEKYDATLREYVAAGIPRARAKATLMFAFRAGSGKEPVSAAEYVAKHPEYAKRNSSGTEVSGELTPALIQSSVGRVSAKLFSGKSCDERTAVQWVFENLFLSGVKPEKAPSAGAWGLLQKCLMDRKYCDHFLESIWPKLLPSKSQLETVAKFEDPGTPALDLIRTLRAKTQGVVELVQ